MITAQDAVILGNAELERGMRAAQAVAIVFSLPALILGMLALGLRDWTFAYVSGGVFGLGMCLAGALIVQGHRQGQGQVDKVIKHNHEVYAPKTPLIIDGESTRQLPEPTLPALPTLPDAEETFHYTRNGVGEDVPKKELHGFDPRFLAFMCRYLARGGRWVEDVLEKMELPYSNGEVMGKAEEGTPYQRLFGPEGVFIVTEIITGRAPKKAGKLMVHDAGEMMERIKALAV